MNFNKDQRDLLISQMAALIESTPTRTAADKHIKNVIGPAIVELAKDCNDLEEKLDQALAVNEELRKVIKDMTAPSKSNWGGGPL